MRWGTLHVQIVAPIRMQVGFWMDSVRKIVICTMERPAFPGYAGTHFVRGSAPRMSRAVEQEQALFNKVGPLFGYIPIMLIGRLSL